MDAKRSQNDVETLAEEPMSFFPHDANAAQDVKCRRLMRRRGFDGYGRWWRLCEYLATIKGHKLAFETEEDVLIAADVLGFGGGAAFDEYLAIDECKSFVGDLVDIGLLETDGDGSLMNRRMLNNALYFGRQRFNGRRGGRPKKDSVTSKATGQEA